MKEGEKTANKNKGMEKKNYHEIMSNLREKQNLLTKPWILGQVI